MLEATAGAARCAARSARRAGRRARRSCPRPRAGARSGRGSSPTRRARSSWRAGPRAAKGSPIRSTSSSVNPFRQPGTISSSVVPEWSRTAAGERLELGPVGVRATGPGRRPRRGGCAPARSKARSALLERFVRERDHRVALRRGRCRPDSGVAHHGPAGAPSDRPGTRRSRRPCPRAGRATRRTNASLQSRPFWSAASGIPSTLAIMRVR